MATVLAEAIAAQPDKTPSFVQSNNPPALGTPAHVFTLVPNIGFYMGDVRVADAMSAVTLAAPAIAGTAVLVGSAGDPIKAGDTVTLTFGAVTGQPVPSLSFSYTLDGNTIDVVDGSFIAPDGWGGKALVGTVNADSQLGHAELTSAAKTISNPVPSFPSWTSTWWPMVELTDSPYGRLQFTIDPAATFDFANFRYILTTSDTSTVDQALLDQAIRSGVSEITAINQVLVRNPKAAGKVVYPTITAIRRSTYPAADSGITAPAGSFQAIATKSAYTILATGPTTGGEFPTITHTALAADLATDASFLAWFNGLPGGAIAAIPKKSSGDWTVKLTFGGKKSPAVRLVPVDRSNPPVFAGNRRFNFKGADGVILDGLAFKGITSLKGYPQDDALDFQALSGEVTNCVFDFFHKIVIAGFCTTAPGKPRGKAADVKIHHNTMTRVNIDACDLYYGADNFEWTDNWHYNPLVDPDAYSGVNGSKEEHSDLGFQTALNRVGIVGQRLSSPDAILRLVYSRNRVDCTGNKKATAHVALFHNELLSKGSDWWHGDLIVQDNWITSRYVHALSPLGWLNPNVSRNYLEYQEDMPKANAGIGYEYPQFACFTSVAAGKSPTNVGIFADNVVPFKMHQNAWKPPVGAWTYTNNVEDNYNKTTGLNGSARPVGFDPNRKYGAYSASADKWRMTVGTSGNYRGYLGNVVPVYGALDKLNFGAETCSYFAIDSVAKTFRLALVSTGKVGTFNTCTITLPDGTVVSMPWNAANLRYESAANTAAYNYLNTRIGQSFLIKVVFS